MQHVIALNERGYRDYFNRDLGVFLQSAHWPTNTKYVVISTTPSMEINAYGCATLKTLKESLTNREGSWETDSVWKNGRQLKFKVVAIVNG